MLPALATIIRDLGLGVRAKERRGDAQRRGQAIGMAHPEPAQARRDYLAVTLLLVGVFEPHAASGAKALP